MENPVLLQKASRRNKSAVPLFLFHDGGGTILPYYFLESLDRNVWGISYPHIYNGELFENGIEGMGELYAGFVRSKIPRGKVLLGGKFALRFEFRHAMILTTLLGWSAG